jgi:Uma2 family endonuclease
MAHLPLPSLSPGPRRPATLADWEAVPAPYTAHLIDGELYVLPKPLPRHARAAGGVYEALVGPFDRKRGGPGGWLFLLEVDILLGRDVVAPDLAGWRRERLAEVPNETPVRVAPDWCCEVLSPRTEVFDRGAKAAWYAAAGVQSLWLVDPDARTLEAYRNDAGAWRPEGRWQGEAEVTAAPFETPSWSLATLWV